MLKQMNVAELRPGMMVTQVIEQNGPVKIRRVGLVKSEAMIKGLTEMGVSTVEVDLSQSLVVDNDAEDLAIKTQNPKSTPTRRLIDNDRQVEQVDRQLSQQFHNSLFMPAIEEMPSVFQLYAKPISFVAAFAILGFSLGFLVMQSPKLVNLLQTSNDQLTSAGKVEQSVSQSTPQSTSLNRNSANTGQSNKLSTISSDDGPTSDTDVLPNTETTSVNQLSENDETNPLAVSSENNQAEIGTNNSDSETNENAVSIDEQAPVTYVNGVALQSGERVLGYQGEEENSSGITETNDNGVLSDVDRIEIETGGRVINNPNEASNADTFSDLLRRVNEAAAEVKESEPLPNDPNFLPSDTFLSDDNPAPSSANQNGQSVTTPTRYQRLDELPLDIQNVLPSMSFSAHMFASEPEDRWVRVNSLRRQENEFITDGLRIFEIQSDKVILEYRGERFSMNALSDW